MSRMVNNFFTNDRLKPGVSPRARPTCAGTTLMELLVVLFIISILLGIGVGVFGKFSLVNAAGNTAAGLRTMVRVIRDHARNHGTAGTIALLTRRAAEQMNLIQAAGSDVTDEKEQNELRYVLGLMERVVGQWHFEQEDGGTTGAFGYNPLLSGGAELVPDGCIGGAVKLDGKGGTQVVLGNSPTFESNWGVSLFADLWRDDDQSSGTVLAKGEAFGLRVESDGTLVGWVGVTEEDGNEQERLAPVEVSSDEEKVPVGKWARVGLYYDRVQLRIFIDYRQVGETQEQRALGREPDRALSVGGAAGAIRGKVDGVRLGALGPGDSGALPAEVKLTGGTRVIRFDAEGNLDPRYHRVPAKIVLEGGDGTSRTVVIGLMGDVSLE